MSQFRDDNKTGRYILWGVLAVLAIIVFFSSFYTIRSTERGVLATFGKMSDTVVEDGLHLKIPFIQTIKRVNVQQKKHDGKENSYTRDVQTSVVEYTINYDLVRENVSKLMKNVGEDYHNRIVVPFIRSAMKEAFGNFAATEIVENRDAVRREIESTLRRTLDSNYFMNVQFQLVDIVVDGHKFTFVLSVVATHTNTTVIDQFPIKIRQLVNQRLLQSDSSGGLFTNHFHYSITPVVPTVFTVGLIIRIVADIERNELHLLRTSNRSGAEQHNSQQQSTIQ